ncbi:MAG: DUF3592 domain-containing protein [Burkholderiales bacterium]|nr:DUF3592 domain-containing protein [Burkholderiales bacterium]
MKYEYWQDKKRVWCWHLTGDGQVVAHGEGYVDKPDVLRAIDLSRRSRPGEGEVGQSRRYRLSFAALLAIVVAAGCFWGSGAVVLPRWDGSLVAVDADVVRTVSHGSGKHRSTYTTVTFATLDGRSVTTTMPNSSVESGTTAVRVRYNPLNPKEAIEDSNIIPYVGSMTFLFFAGWFLWLARKASLHDGQKYFM